jgi:acyl carrier protein
MLEQIFERVKAIAVKEFNLQDPTKVTMETTFNQLGIDSLDLVEFVMRLEEEFKCDIPDQDQAKIQSVGDAVRFLEGRMGASNTAS